MYHVYYCLRYSDLFYNLEILAFNKQSKSWFFKFSKNKNRLDSCFNNKYLKSSQWGSPKKQVKASKSCLICKICLTMAPVKPTILQKYLAFLFALVSARIKNNVIWASRNLRGKKVKQCRRHPKTSAEIRWNQFCPKRSYLWLALKSSLIPLLN